MKNKFIENKKEIEFVFTFSLNKVTGKIFR